MVCGVGVRKVGPGMKFASLTGSLHEAEIMEEQWITDMRATTVLPQKGVSHTCHVTTVPNITRSDIISVNGPVLSKPSARPVHVLGDCSINTEATIIVDFSTYEGTETPFGRQLGTRDGTLLEAVFGESSRLGAAITDHFFPKSRNPGFGSHAAAESVRSSYNPRGCPAEIQHKDSKSTSKMHGLLDIQNLG